MPQLDVSAFETQLVWLAITFVALYVVMAWVALPRVARVFESREERINADLARAEELRKEAGDVLTDYEASLADARSAAKKAMNDAMEKAAEDAAKKEQALAKELAVQTGEAEKRIASARDQAVAQLTEIAVSTAQEAAAKLIGVTVDKAAAENAVATARAARGQE